MLTVRFDSLRADIRRWGWLRGLFSRAMSGFQRHTGLRIYRVNLRPLGGCGPAPVMPRGIEVRIVEPAELIRAAGDAELDLCPEFVSDALARGDMAFGAFEGDRLVGYTWRTFTAAPHVEGLWARVERPYQISYKAYTRPSHRRLHIHVAVTALADDFLRARGYAAEVGFVEIINFSGLALADFMGRRGIGYAGHLGRFGRRIPFRTPAVRKIGVALFERKPGGATPRAAADRAVPAGSPGRYI